MFCKYCGTQVPDGYICGCPDSQRAAQAAAASVPQPGAHDQYAGQYDPNAQYPGQYDQYDPNAQYPGQYDQYDPNAQYPGQYDQYDPNAQYPGQYDPNAQYADPYDSNTQYGYPPQPPVTPQPPAGPSFGQKLGQALKDMPTTFKTLKADIFGTGVDVLTGGIFAVGSFVLNILAWLFVFIGIFGDGLDMYGTIFLTAFLAWLVPTVLVMLIPVFGQLARKEDVDFAKCFVQAACANLLPTAMIFLSSLFMLMSAELGMILLTVTLVQSIAIVAKLVKKQMKNADGLFGVLLVGVIAAAIVLLAAWIISAPFTDYIKMMFRGFL